jgi:hypothetical protein
MSVPLIAIFNAANRALRSAKYNADRELYDAASGCVATAGAFVQLLQTYSPPQTQPGTTLRHRKDSLSGVAVMFHYQVEVWGISPDDIEDGLFSIDEPS